MFCLTTRRRVFERCECIRGYKVNESTFVTIVRAKERNTVWDVSFVVV